MGYYGGKNVVITGGGSGIGFGIAKLLVDGGARVIITGRSRATLDIARRPGEGRTRHTRRPVRQRRHHPHSARRDDDRGGVRRAVRDQRQGRELLPRGVRVNAVSPGPVDTGILETMMTAEAAEQFRAERVAENPMRRFGTPGEIAGAAAFLAFDATYTTGAELVVDGGASQL